MYITKHRPYGKPQVFRETGPKKEAVYSLQETGHDLPGSLNSPRGFHWTGPAEGASKMRPA